MRMWKRIVIGTIAAAVLIVTVVRPVGSGRIAEREQGVPDTIVMAGSTSMEKLANMLAERFMEEHPGVTVTAEFTGSSAGVQAVLSGRAKIGLSSRELTEVEKESGAVGSVAALDGIAVITDAANPVAALTAGQLADIYTGRIRNWQELGGERQPIVVIGREAGSGTRSSFEALLGIRDRCLYANELDSEGAVMARTAATPGALGYVSFSVLNDSVHTLAINGVEAAVEKVSAGEYLLSRNFFLVTKKEGDGQKGLVREIVGYLRTEEGRELIRSAGLAVPDA